MLPWWNCEEVRAAASCPAPRRLEQEGYRRRLGLRHMRFRRGEGSTAGRRAGTTPVMHRNESPTDDAREQKKARKKRQLPEPESGGDWCDRSWQLYFRRILL